MSISEVRSTTSETTQCAYKKSVEQPKENVSIFSEKAETKECKGGALGEPAIKADDPRSVKNVENLVSHGKTEQEAKGLDLVMRMFGIGPYHDPLSHGK